MNLFEDCLKSIELAQAGKCPEQLRDLLNKMTVKCHEKISSGEKQETPFRLELSYPSNPKIPSVASCLELQTSEECGRYIVTTRDLKVGDVVIMERPFVACLRTTMRYNRCAHCMAGDKRHLLMPCPTCTSALYCSEECRTVAWSEYHRLECKLSEKLDDLNDPQVQMAVRSLLVSVSVYGGVRKFQEFIADHKNSNRTVFDVDNEDRKMLVLALNHFQSEENFLPLEVKGKYIESAVHWIHTFVRGNVFEEEIDQELVEFLLQTLYRFMISATLNSFRTSTQFPPYYLRTPVYASQQLAMTMINHSCAPNVSRYQQGDLQVLVVQRPIAKGEALGLGYIKVFWSTPKVERQRFYYAQYGFLCKCTACELNYPVKSQCWVQERFKPLQINRTMNPVEMWKAYSEYMQRNDRYFPCLQLYEVETKWDLQIIAILAAHLWEH